MDSSEPERRAGESKYSFEKRWLKWKAAFPQKQSQTRSRKRKLDYDTVENAEYIPDDGNVEDDVVSEESDSDKEVAALETDGEVRTIFLCLCFCFV